MMASYNADEILLCRSLLKFFGPILLLSFLAGLGILRAYMRTSARSYLLLAGGVILGILTAFSSLALVNKMILIVGGSISGLMLLSGMIGITTFDSGIHQEIWKRTPLFQRILGNIPRDFKGKEIKPFFKKKTGIIMGSTMVAYSFFWLYFRTVYPEFPCIPYFLFFVIWGIVLIIFSVRH
jgi:hypothetical protein